MSCLKCKSDDNSRQPADLRTTTRLPRPGFQGRTQMRINIRLIGRSVVALLAMTSLAVAATDLRLVDAAKAGDTEAVQRLLKQGVPVNGAQPDGFTALHWTAQLDKADMADLLIRAGGKVGAA